MSERAARYARARIPRARVPWREADWCVVDLELSGLDPREHEIISFAGVPIEAGRVQLHSAVHGLVRPSRALTEHSIRVHGIRAADLRSSPPLDEAIGPLLDVMAGCVIVAHSAAVERGFLGPALRRQGTRLRGPLADTVVLGSLWLCERDGVGPSQLPLPGLAAALGLPVHRQHDALGDALTTAQAFIALASHLDARQAETVGSLVRAERRLQRLLAYAPRASVSS